MQGGQSNERKLFLSLTDAGAALKEKALAVPCAMRECIALTEEEMIQLKHLLDKTLNGMEAKA